MVTEALLADLRALLGPRGLLEGPDTDPYVEDWRRLYRGQTRAVIRPPDTQTLAAAMRLCVEARTPVVPQGGNTSMVGGATPPPDSSALVISLARLDRLRAIDPVDLTMTIDAGVTLKAAQDHAANANCLLPLSISAEGSAQIGGILATNAGGNNTVRYGNARDLVLGLEVVLADGQIWNGLRRLRKDNTGYCLRQLFVGSEGTLGIITAAVLKLAPRPTQTEIALCAVPTPAAALALFARFQHHDAAAIQAFEYMSGASMALVLTHIPNTTLPLDHPAPHYVLVELAAPRPGPALRDSLESLLEHALTTNLITDATIASSDTQARAIWRLREEHSEAQKRAGANIKNDISVPVSQIPALLETAAAAATTQFPGVIIAPFGHIGDGNIHFNLIQPPHTDPETFLSNQHALMDAVNAAVRALDGSFSAEHGIGQLKPDMLADWRAGPELELMHRIKAALDPAGLLNPGKVIRERKLQ